MALDIPLDPHNTGLVSRYWAITAAHLDHLRDQATIWLHGWRDQDARHAGLQPAASLTLMVPGGDIPGGLHAAHTQSLYQALRARAEAAEADAARGFEHAAHAIAAIDHAILAAAKDC